MPLSHLMPKQAKALATARAKGDAGLQTPTPEAFEEKIAPFLPPGG
jgi:hypothetical protein